MENGGQPLFAQIPRHKRSSYGLAAIHIHKNEDGTATLQWIRHQLVIACYFLQFKNHSIRQVTFNIARG
ncbi:hypothetical protein LIS77_22725 [Cytobacillus firmus]|uniref:hypothetical protein n=1 Tax=Cytobacillus firmus TaxID=1399 RepID=UPI002079CA89|nr:hypothetical protein [Cytobacillus firmus]USK38669.1 hypothetical protein LIS77_22725 [Cytobacillus firmus]